MDLRPHVNRQLDFIAGLIRELGDCDDDQTKLRLFREMCNRSVLHTVSRERVLVPAWRRVGWKEFPFASFRAHVQFKRSLADLVLHPPAAQGHSEVLSAFAAHVDRQRVLDDECLVPLMRSAMDVSHRRDLCNDMELLFNADRGADCIKPSIEASPREFLLEAQIVLTSLASHPESERVVLG